MNSVLWNDTYSIAIKFFMVRFNDVPDIVRSLFTRKLLKRSIMTTNYNVTFYSFYRYFFASIDSYLPDLELSYEDIKVLVKWLKILYSFVLSDLFSLIFFKNKVDYIKGLDAKKIELEDISIDISYLESVDGPREDNRLRTSRFRYNSRMTFVTKILTDKLDEKQTARSLEPNLIQAHDALLARETLAGTPVIFLVHDCFGFFSNDIGEVFDFQNEYFLKRIIGRERSVLVPNKEAPYSIFILL